jgi:thymidylate synthase ThyX
MKVYAVVGVPPEIQAYAMAKYSRSAQSMLESIGELSVQRAEQFLNTFYFQYGHRSIADLAHLVLAVEDVSILAAVRVVDEPLWDGQERSTRYQPFKKTGYFTPPELEGDLAARYRAAGDALFQAYDRLTADLLALLIEHVPRPDDVEQRPFERTLRARAFDVSRSLLPLATITSLGQVVSARVLERQISRLLSDPFPEVRRIGAELRRACEEPAETPGTNGSAEPPRAAPTLVKYTHPIPYLTETWRELQDVARSELASLGPADRSRTVELAEDESPLDEAVTTLLYKADLSGHSYRQIQVVVRAMSEGRKREVLKRATARRGPHDELLRELQVGYAFKFDILMDYGSFRDMHRHRRCIQILQEPIPDHGVEPATEIFPRAFGSDIAARALEAGLGETYDGILADALARARDLAGAAPLAAPYLLPLATRTRALFKMDAAQAAYIAELRTQPGGHFSYRRVAWEMFEALRERAPELAGMARPTDPREVFDLLQR